MIGAESHLTPIETQFVAGDSFPTSLLDTKGTFSKCDELLKDISVLKSEINRGYISQSLAKLNPMHTWNDKRRNISLMTRAESLTSSIMDKEAEIRLIIGKAAENKEKIRCESALLKHDVIDSITYIESLCIKMEILVENMRFFIDAVTRDTEEVKNMVKFNREIIRQEQSAMAASDTGSLYGRWRAANRGG